MSEANTVYGHINWGPEMEEVGRADLGPKWCFQCRRRHSFVRVVMAPVELSYYGPHQEIRCTVCNGEDTDLFPDRVRDGDGRGW